MSNAIHDAIIASITTIYIDRKGTLGSRGADFAGKAFDAVRKDDFRTAWPFAVLAEREDRVSWGILRAEVEAFALHMTGGTFESPFVPNV